jgi:geranylgeranyl pyrophosphate synthase
VKTNQDDEMLKPIFRSPAQARAKLGTQAITKTRIDALPEARAAKSRSDAIARLERFTQQLGQELDSVLCDAIPIAVGGHDRLGTAMRYAVVSGGKRFRAALVVAVAELVGASYQHALRVGAAIECVHAQSLVHDDLPCMDDDDTRRGKPALHKAFDEATAVLAGDALLALAFEILGDKATHPDSAVRIRLVTGLARAVGHMGMASGQMMDLYPPDQPSEEHISTCQFLKTATLIRFAVEAGAMLGDSRHIDIPALTDFAMNLGRVFQMRDDLLDAIGDAQVLGKAVGKDAVAGRHTALGLLGLDGAKQRACKLARECEDALDAFASRDCLLRDIAVFAADRLH